MARDLGLGTPGAELESCLRLGARAEASPMSGDRRETVRVMRKRVPGLDEVPSADIKAEIGQLEELLANPGQRMMRWPTAARRLKDCRTALEPDFQHTKVHHHSDCWYVNRYEEGCFPGDAPVPPRPAR
jgi:hypothetical protein